MADLSTPRKEQPELPAPSLPDLTEDEKTAMKRSSWITQGTTDMVRRGVETLILFFITVAIMAVGMYYSPLIVFGVLILSLCTCAYIPVMNLPLYACVFWLVIQGWTITSHQFKLVWDGTNS